MLLSKLFNLRMIDKHQITPEFCISLLEEQGFFDPYNKELLNYEYLMHIAQNTRVQLDFVSDTIELRSIQ